jgi:hypothetical protein
MLRTLEGTSQAQDKTQLILGEPPIFLSGSAG